MTIQSPHLSDDMATREPHGGDVQLLGEEEDQHGGKEGKGEGKAQM